MKGGASFFNKKDLREAFVIIALIGAGLSMYVAAMAGQNSASATRGVLSVTEVVVNTRLVKFYGEGSEWFYIPLNSRRDPRKMVVEITERTGGLLVTVRQFGAPVHGTLFFPLRQTFEPFQKALDERAEKIGTLKKGAEVFVF